jgi:soluble lytic murein transglycosylase-like protein
MRFVGLLLIAVSTALAGEYAVLSGGARLLIIRHEVDGATVRLYTNSGGFIEMASTAVARFEPDLEAKPVPAAVSEPVPTSVSPAIVPALKPEELADAAADKYGLPRKLVRSVMAAESAFNPKAVSPKGAIGLMQLMPKSAQMLGADPNDPAQNVDAGTRYLRDLLVKYNGLLWHALAAYNAGPGTVDKYNGIPPYRDTLKYVNRIDRALTKGDPSSRPE